MPPSLTPVFENGTSGNSISLLLNFDKSFFKKNIGNFFSLFAIFFSTGKYTKLIVKELYKSIHKNSSTF